jgi:ankyrin repeat protein
MGAVAVVRTFLAHGADPNVRTRWQQQTSAHLLAEDASISIIQFETMLAHGADITCQDEDGVAHSPLLRASEVGQGWLQTNPTMWYTE